MGFENEKFIFWIRLADVTIKIYANYRSTREYCRDYLTTGPEAFSVMITQRISQRNGIGRRSRNRSVEGKDREDRGLDTTVMHIWKRWRYTGRSQIR